ncbi:unnamed protein product [Linum tenue]|uniref:Uncharacterized protein n=1 Tax=Linum tenue TaxID=586396 RepID=A0AAV0M6V6_9ROSI|nr:unnamed protein product [Linum tenue]
MPPRVCPATERGEIFFFYRPRVNREEAHSLDDVQRLFIVLRPESGDRPTEDKQEPDSGKEGSKRRHDSSSSPSGSKEGGHGVQVHSHGAQIPSGPKQEQGPPLLGLRRSGDYETASGGKRHEAAARAVGEGVYRILRHNPGSKKMHTHLVYKLELPAAEGKTKSHEPQEALHIEREGSFVIQIKNPESGSGSGSGFGGLREKRRAQFPAHLQGGFGTSRRFGPADPPDLLNYEGCEFLMIAAADDVEEELGLELEVENERWEEEGSCSDLVKEFGDVVAPAPLLEGTWA